MRKLVAIMTDAALFTIRTVAIIALYIIPIVGASIYVLSADTAAWALVRLFFLIGTIAFIIRVLYLILDGK